MQRAYITAGEKFCTVQEHVSAPLFKKVFNWEKKPCRLEISAAGIYRLFLNGEDLTKGFFAPYISNPDHVVYFDEYDLSGKLKRKGNVLCVMLGNGFNNVVVGGWQFDKAEFRSAPKFYLSLSDGEETVFATGGEDDFLVTESAVTFDDIRGGERYDARKERAGIFTDCNTDGFVPAKIARLQPKGEYRLRTADPVLSFEEIAPVEIFKSGEYHIFDFGQNNAGVCRLKIDGRKGQTVDIWHVEALADGLPEFNTVAFETNDREYVQHDQYICKDGLQEYAPSFTYHGFRYACVKGLTDEQANKQALTYVVRHSAIRSRGQFSCNSELLNTVQEWTVRSDLSNFHCFPTDCPHREKNGWTGDVNLSAEQMMYNFDSTASFREWLHNIRATQIEDGRIACIVPTSGWKYEGANGPAWDEVLVELPYQIYRFTGNKDIIEENADAIEKYFRFLFTKINENGLIRYGMTDWCETGNTCHYGVTTSLEIIDSLISVDSARKAACLFREIGREKFADELDSFADRLIVNFRKMHLTAEAKIGCPSQTALSLAILLGAYKPEELPVAYAQLREAVERADGHFKVGVIGMKYVFDALVQGDMLDLAVEMLEKEDFPSFGYMKKLGATTLWEAFLEFEEDGVKNLKRILRSSDIPSWAAGLPSLNHHFFGSVSAWFYRVLAGINVVGKGRVCISPRFPKSLTFVQACVEDGENFIKVRWEKNGDEICLTTSAKGFVGEIAVDGYLVQGKPKISLEDGEKTYRLKKIS